MGLVGGVWSYKGYIYQDGVVLFFFFGEARECLDSVFTTYDIHIHVTSSTRNGQRYNFTAMFLLQRVHVVFPPNSILYTTSIALRFLHTR